MQIPPGSLPAPPALLSPAARASYAPVTPVLARLREAGHEAVLVGGGIRDLLLGRTPGDWDVATSASPDTVMGLWPEAVPTGARHGTVTLPLPTGPVEITTYRTEGPYSDGRRPDWVRFDAGLAQDLLRRDFTVNAMALDPQAGRLWDPAGGLADLDARRLRAVGDPDLRFAEDGLRPFRGIRLAAVLEFTLDPGTLAAMGRARETARGVARERVRDELLKLLAARRPSEGIERLRETGLLTDILPELLEGLGVTQNRHHAYDVYRHTLSTLDAAPPGRPRVRLAALLHDVGKPRARAVENGEASFHGHERVGAAMTEAILTRLRLPVREVRSVSHLVAQHMFHYTPDWTDGAVRRFLRRVGTEHVDDLFALRRADDAGAGTGKDPEGALGELARRIEGVLAREEALTVADLDLTGNDLAGELGMAPGPDMGRLLAGLLDWVLEDPERNRRDLLLKEAARRRRSS